MTQAQDPNPSAFMGSQARVLVVDDEDLVRETVSLALTAEGYSVTTASSGLQAIELLCPPKAEPPAAPVDLAILDLMLPGINGLDICRLVRHRNLDLLILMMSARGSEMDRVVGLEVGADDYLAKPFGMRELVARCRALLRRQHWAQQLPAASILTFKNITLYLKEFRVTIDQQEVMLSPKEFRILELFLSHPNRVWSREDLIQAVWGADFVGDRKTVDVHIRWLREKIEPDPSRPQYLTTLRGFGYRFG